MAPSAPARWILTGLISIGLQLCCCNLEAVAGGCCESEQSGAHTRLAAADVHWHAHQELGDDHHHGSPAGSHDRDLPAGPGAPGNHHGDGGCTCGNHDKAPDLAAKVTCPTQALVAILPPPAGLSPSLRLGAPRCARLHAAPPPPTSLLRQHCALNV